MRTSAADVVYVFSFFFFKTKSRLLCSPGWSAVAQSWLTVISDSWIQVILVPQLPDSWDNRYVPSPWLIFVILVETGFHHICQAGLELLTLGDPPALASQSAGIIGIKPLCLASKFLF